MFCHFKTFCISPIVATRPSSASVEIYWATFSVVVRSLPERFMSLRSFDSLHRLSQYCTVLWVLALFRNSEILIEFEAEGVEGGVMVRVKAKVWRWGWEWGWKHDDLDIYSFSLELTAGSSKLVYFLKFSVLYEILMLVEFTLFEFLLSCYFSKIRKIPKWKDCWKCDYPNYCQILFNGKFSLFWNSDCSECSGTVGH